MKPEPTSDPFDKAFLSSMSTSSNPVYNDAQEVLWDSNDDYESVDIGDKGRFYSAYRKGNPYHQAKTKEGFLEQLELETNENIIFDDIADEFPEFEKYADADFGTSEYDQALVLYKKKLLGLSDEDFIEKMNDLEGYAEIEHYLAPEGTAVVVIDRQFPHDEGTYYKTYEEFASWAKSLDDE